MKYLLWPFLTGAALVLLVVRTVSGFLRALLRALIGPIKILSPPLGCLLELLLLPIYVPIMLIYFTSVRLLREITVLDVKLGFAEPEKEEVRLGKDDFSKEELQKEVVQIKSKMKPQKEMNNIEEYDVELTKDMIRLEGMYEKDRDFDRKEIEAFGDLSEEQVDKLVSETVLGPLGHGLIVKKRLQWEKQASEYMRDFSFRVAILHLIGPLGMPVKVYTKEKVFNFDESALTEEEQGEFARHCEKSIIGSHDATLSNRISYPSLELMRFMATVLEKYGAEKLQETV